MAALDVITLQEVKDWLQVDQSDTYYDGVITELIEEAINWVEMYTRHYLWARDIDIYPGSCQTSIYLFPINSLDVVNGNGDSVKFKRTNREGKIVVSTGLDDVIKLNVGYSNVIDIPKQLITAAKKRITYNFENRDSYEITLPIDIQLGINMLRRGLF